jgi:hypothetical protein
MKTERAEIEGMLDKMLKTRNVNFRISIESKGK